MKCRRCQHDNLPDAKFCPQCAHPASDHARETSAATESAPAEPIGGERRQATVVFADISGYTQICSSMDAEHVQALLDRFYAAIDPTIAAYGGSVIDHAGDGVLA